MNKYYVELGEACLERITESFIVYSNKSKEELEWDDDFLQAVDEAFMDMYNNYGEEDEDWEDFQSSMDILKIEDWKDEYEAYRPAILLDERK